MRKEDDTHDEGARPSSLRPVHKLSTPDPLYDQQLLRDVEIINARTRAELGPPPRVDRQTHIKRKPILPRLAEPDGTTVRSSYSEAPSDGRPTVVTMHEDLESDPMKLRDLAMAAGLSVAAASVPTAYASVPDPVWPNNGIAEREIGDGENTWPENMFVEHVDGQWIVWVLMSPNRGQAKALNFFSGEVIPVTVKNPGDYDDSFIDAHGVTHKSAIHPAFGFKDPRPGGGLDRVNFSAGTLEFDDDAGCAPLYLRVSQGMSYDDKTVLWSKLPLYKTNPWPEACRDGVWDSLVSTALDLRDGTLLITGGKFVFRIHQDDMRPVGEAPHLRVVDEADVKRVIDMAKGKRMRDVSAFLTEQLHLD